MVKIAVLASGGGTNLQAVIDYKKNGGIKNGELALLIASKSAAFAIERAKAAGMETLVMSPKEYSTREEYTIKLVETLKARGIGLVILAGFMYILSPEFTKAYKNAVLNVHPALIPSFCGTGFFGLKPHEAALKRGVKVSGATVHFVNEETDGGPIILQKAVEVLPGDTAEILQKRVMEQAEWKILPRATELFCDGKLFVNDDNIVEIKE